MRKIDGVTVIDVVWDGPVPFDRVTEAKADHDFGVYQVYGTHAVFGPDCLLYIGLAEQQRFGVRVPSHIAWTEWQSSPTNVYLGRLAGRQPIDKTRYEEWGEMIVRAEDLLIYYCSPPYNSRSINTLRSHPPTVLLNYRRHHRLPAVISNLGELSSAEQLSPFREHV
jgi:hypothetical protein